MEDKLKNYEVEGQLDIFDLYPDMKTPSTRKEEDEDGLRVEHI